MLERYLCYLHNLFSLLLLFKHEQDNVDKGYVKAVQINGIETEVRVDIEGA
jgi:hypothetical protein